jgi:acetyl esterase/lipase
MATAHAPPGATSATGTTNESSSLLDKDPVATQLPLLRRLGIGLALYSFQAFVYVGLRILSLSKYLSNTHQPTFKTYYSVRPKLPVHVFLPPKHVPASSTKLPTYINIHGGGFALCNPVVDDPFCHHLSTKYGYLVISLSYSLSPQHPFPAAVEDIMALIPAILSDTSLPIDLSRVALGGFSAGGNLTLAAAQSPSVGPKLKALVPIYPVVDFSGRYKGKFRTNNDGTPDMLQRTGAWFNWGYISPGMSLTDPLLSPIYADRASLPRRVFFVGCEYDVLCHEAHEMAKKLVGPAAQRKREDEDWDMDGVKWLRVKGQRHGFTHTTEKGRREQERAEATDALWKEVDVWVKGVFEQDSTR